MEMRHRDGDRKEWSDEKTGSFNQGYKQDNGSLDEIAVTVDQKTTTDDDQEEQQSSFACYVSKVTDGAEASYNKNQKTIWRGIYSLLIALYVAYFVYALYWSFGDEGSIRLLWITCVVVFFVIVNLISTYHGKSIAKAFRPCIDGCDEHGERISWIAVGIIWAAIFIYIIVDVTTISKRPYNLVSAVGIIVYIALMFVTSYSPSKVRWRTVVWGMALQFVFALLILRWSVGFLVFEWLGARVTEFLAHSDAGARFLFGSRLLDEFVFAFKVLPVIIFFSTAISVLYYLGAMQHLIMGIAWIMRITMGTTAGESLNAAGNIFIGQSEAPLLIRPLIQDMTRSELHAVMTGGFATIAGSVLGAYISFGVPANHLLSASVMSAPAALAISKLFYPETEKSKTTSDDVKTMEKSEARNIVEAASTGAIQSIALIANISVSLIAFLSILNFLNDSLRWFGARAGLVPPHIDFTFEFITSYLFWPFAFIMGIEAIDCRQVARLIGLKTFLNEFIAYDQLGKLVENRVTFYNHLSQNGTWYYEGSNIILNGTTTAVASLGSTTTLLNGIIYSERSLVISTYALCGFANFGSIGIMIGTLSAMAPHRRAEFASIAVRAMIAGNVACFMTACIAGLFFDGTAATPF